DDPQNPLFLGAFKRGLAAQGWMEGRDLQIDYRFGVNSAQLAADAAPKIIALRPDILVTVGQLVPDEIKQAASFPIVFSLVTSDPVASGLVQTMAHPGGNLTGFTNSDPAITGKLVEMLKQVAPATKRIAWLAAIAPSPTDLARSAFQSAAAAFGLEPVFF